MKKILSIALVVVLLAGIAVSGTMAYLTSEDSDVNVMTLGNVKIDQIELERKEQSDGNVTSENLKEFSQDKPLYPAVGTLAWADKYQEWETGGSNQLFTADLKNVQDKFVFVENTGKSDAYVRTFVAFEQGSMTEEEFEAAVGYNINKGFWTWENVAYGVKIKDADGVEGTYAIKVATYKGNADGTVHKDGILPAGETTRPSLLQVLLYSTVTNEDVDAIDGNGNDTYDILVFSEAVQTEGFADAATALNTAFGDTAEGYHPWDEEIKWPGVIYTADEAYDATLTSGTYTLGTDYKPSDTARSYSANRTYAVKDDKEITINLNGHTINHDTVYGGFTYMYTVAYNSTLTINGDGTIISTNGADHASEENCIVYAQSTGEVVINGGNYNPENGIAAWAGSGAHITINGGNFVSSGEKQCELIYSSGGVIDIYGGFFHNTAWDNRPVNVANANRGTGFINIYGGTYVNFDPSTGGDDPNNIKVADGYKVVSETQANGEVWYTVVPE